MPPARHASFAPHVAPDARLLILGSLPGARSLAERRYYAHPTNQFWRLLGGVIDRPIASLAYDDRLDELAGARVGLWDVKIGRASGGERVCSTCRSRWAPDV